MIEMWKPVVGYRGRYEVSNTGKIRSPRCELKPHKNHKGYLMVGISKKGKRTGKTIHSLVMAAFVGKRPKGYQIEHKDHNKMNNYWPSNIRYCTRLENMGRNAADARNAYGDYNGQSKLSAEKAKIIRQTKGLSQREIAKKYNVSPSCICLLLQGKTWRAR